MAVIIIPILHPQIQAIIQAVQQQAQGQIQQSVRIRQIPGERIRQVPEIPPPLNIFNNFLNKKPIMKR